MSYFAAGRIPSTVVNVSSNAVQNCKETLGKGSQYREDTGGVNDGTVAQKKNRTVIGHETTSMAMAIHFNCSYCAALMRVREDDHVFSFF
jgi:hypothetical protein